MHEPNAVIVKWSSRNVIIKHLYNEMWNGVNVHLEWNTGLWAAVPRTKEILPQLQGVVGEGGDKNASAALLSLVCKTGKGAEFYTGVQCGFRFC